MSTTAKGTKHEAHVAGSGDGGADVVRTIRVEQEVVIEAGVEEVFASVLEELGPGSQGPDGTPYPMTIEAKPGGRWYRDHGNDTGHLWGIVQVIKPPPHDRPLLELIGPLFMSYPATNFLQYRLEPEGKRTRLKLQHRAMGLIPVEHTEGVKKGWAHAVGRIKLVAEEKARRAGGKKI